MLDTCTLFPKVLPPKGDKFREIMAFKIQRRSINTTIHFMVHRLKNGSRVLYLGMFYEFAAGMDPYAAFLFLLCSEPQKDEMPDTGTVRNDLDVNWNVLQSWYNFTNSVEYQTFFHVGLSSLIWIYGLSYVNQPFHCKHRILVNMCWVHLYRKRLVATPRWGNNALDARHYEEYYPIFRDFFLWYAKKKQCPVTVVYEPYFPKQYVP